MDRHGGAKASPRGDRTATIGLVVAIVCLLSGVLGACADTSVSADPPARADRATEPTEVVWVNQGAADEDPWTAAQRRAANSVAATEGRNVRVRFIENVELGTPTDRTLEDAVDAGADLVIATSLAQEPFMVAAAQRHPDVRFEQVRGSRTLPNLATFTGAYEQTAYLTGIAAATASRTGRLGVVAQFPQPEMFRIIDGYTLGARSVNPAATVEVEWTNSWWDPPAESAAARDLVARGADVLATTCTSPATGETAQQLGVAWSGHDDDSGERFADVWLTANLTDWGSYYRRRVAELRAGEWRSQEYYGTVAGGFIRTAPLGTRVDGTARATIDVARSRLIDGSLVVFAGPLRDDRGEVRVPAGTAPTVAELLRLDWLVEGARTALPAGTAADGTR
ncbi:MAG: BMP family ABC transporter substrate-binding protein [Microthrixaceae bacterium]